MTSHTLAIPKARPIAIPIMLRVTIRSRLVARNGIGSEISLAARAPLIEPMASPVASAPPWPACPRTIPTTAERTAAPAQTSAALRTRRRAFAVGAGRGDVPSEITAPNTAFLGLSNQGNDINWTSRDDPARSDVRSELGHRDITREGDPDHQADQHAERARMQEVVDAGTPRIKGTIIAAAINMPMPES